MRHAALSILLFTVVSRLIRVGCRWDEWALHYATYNVDTRLALGGGDYAAALGAWVGLHPPGYPLLHAVVSLVWPAPIAWLLLSAVASTVAVWALLKAHPRTVIPALAVATDPVQLHYAVEVTNYPVATMVLALAWMGHRRDRPLILGVAAFLACWLHILVAVGVGIIVAFNRLRLSMVPVMFLAGIFLVPQAWDIAMDGGTRRQPPIAVDLSFKDAVDRFGVSWLLLSPLVVAGFHRAADAALLWCGLIVAWLTAVLLGIGAPHQFPYACFVGIPAAVLLGCTTERWPRAFFVVAAVLIGRGTASCVQEVASLQDVIDDQARPRAIDAVLEQALPGDAIVLVRGPGSPDDDKRHTSPVLWRLSPFSSAAPIVTAGNPAFQGHPFLIDGLRIFTFAHPREDIGRIDGSRVFTILYDGAEQNPERIPDHPAQGKWQSVGTDLWREPIGS